MNNLKNVKLPPASAITGGLGMLVGGVGLTWAASNSLFNVEGGHRAIVFNRFVGIKEEVGIAPPQPHSPRSPEDEQGVSAPA
jgi:prohibitin 2